MKRSILFSVILLFLIPLKGAGSLEEFLKELPLSNIRVMEKESFYSSIYEVMFEQPLDHKDPSRGSFSQKIYISHIDVDRPVIIVTEGYTADYYYTSELASMLKCNQIIVEHRFFGDSQPDSLNWDYLNTWQAASDHHAIIEKFKEFYTNKWISTGISKGGQTAMFHSYYYPDDVDAGVPYVAPLNSAVEDGRIYDFLDQVGTAKCRRKIKRFQKYTLKNQDEIRPAFIEFSKKKDYTYDLVGGYEKAFEYCVLEYSFAFWQWGYVNCSDIPGKQSDPDIIIRHMNRVSGFDYFADEFVVAYQPFFYQALTEMGYYSYDLEDFKDLIRYIDDPGFDFTLPAGADTNFDSTFLSGLDEYVSNELENFIFIYGEYDTWSATAVKLNGNTNSRVFFKEKGSHRTRIRNMPEEQQEEIFTLLDGFLRD